MDRPPTQDQILCAAFDRVSALTPGIMNEPFVVLLNGLTEENQYQVSESLFLNFLFQAREPMHIKIKLVREVLKDFQPEGFFFSRAIIKAIEKELGDLRFVTSSQLQQPIADKIKVKMSPAKGLSVCPYQECQKEFNKVSNTKTHLNSHLNIRMYDCPFPGCGLSFKLKLHLKSHMNRTHLKPVDPTPFEPSKFKFICKYPGCQKGYNTEMNLTIHERKHTGERPFQCHICYKRFPSNGNLTKHAVLHNR